MLFLTAFRRELARAAVGRVATALAADRAVSRGGHFRNGVGALLAASSEVAWRPTPLVSFFYLTRPRVHAQLSQGIAELGVALSPPPALRRRRTLIVGVPASAALVAIAVLRARHRAEDEPDEAPVADAA